MRIYILGGRPKRRGKPANDVNLHSTTFGLPYMPKLADLPVVAPQLLVAAPGYDDEKSSQVALEYMARGFSLGGVAGAMGVSHALAYDCYQARRA